MNLWLVTYEGDLTQFLIEGTDRKTIISEAIASNLEYGRIDDDIRADIENPDNYTLEEVDYNLLDGLFKRNDYYAINDILIFANKNDAMEIFNDVIEDNKDQPEFNADDYEATWEHRGYFNSVTVWEEGLR